LDCCRITPFFVPPFLPRTPLVHAACSPAASQPAGFAVSAAAPLRFATCHALRLLTCTRFAAFGFLLVVLGSALPGPACRLCDVSP